MKLKAVIVLLAVTLAIITASCAGMPPQARPTSIEPFLGNWTGSWRSSVNPSDGGTVSVEIIADTQSRPNGAIYTAMSPQFRMNRIRALREVVWVNSGTFGDDGTVRSRAACR